VLLCVLVAHRLGGVSYVKACCCKFWVVSKLVEVFNGKEGNSAG
jgi:hypothetical protein